MTEDNFRWFDIMNQWFHFRFFNLPSGGKLAGTGNIGACDIHIWCVYRIGGEFVWELWYHTYFFGPYRCHACLSLRPFLLCNHWNHINAEFSFWITLRRIECINSWSFSHWFSTSDVTDISGGVFEIQWGYLSSKISTWFDSKYPGRISINAAFLRMLILYCTARLDSLFSWTQRFLLSPQLPPLLAPTNNSISIHGFEPGVLWTFNAFIITSSVGWIVPWSVRIRRRRQTTPNIEFSRIWGY